MSSEELADIDALAASDPTMARDELVEKFNGVAQFNVLAQKVANTVPDLYVAHGVSEDQKASDFWIRFTATPPQSALDILAASPFRVQVLAKASVPEHQQDEVNSTILDILETTYPETHAFRAGLSVDLDTLEVTWNPDEGMAGGLQEVAERVVELTTATLGWKALPVPVAFSVAPNDAGVEATGTA